MEISVNVEYKFISTMEEINIPTGDITKLKLRGLYSSTNLIKSFDNLTNLTHLDLSYNILTELPVSIDNLTNLTHLDLSYNILTELPVSIGNLTNLTHLHLNCNKLTEFPDSIGNLTNLTCLELGHNKLTELPDIIGNLTNLTCLELGHNKLTELPDIIGNLTNLTELDLTTNKLTELPETISNLTNLTNLNVKFNNLQKLPETIGNLKNLTHLNLIINKLTKLPDSIGNLTNLTHINLGHNKLIKLPDSIGNLTNLTWLYLGHNKLTKLPVSICNLTNLTHLNLSYNKLTDLPLSIINLRRLNEFYYVGNEFDIFPPQIQRFINFIYNKGFNTTTLQVYNDGQNVHNQTIQLSLKHSLEKLTTQKFQINKETIQAEIANDDTLNREAKQLVKSYCNNTEIHSLLLLSFQDVLEYVWETIKLFDKDKQNEIKNIMNQEMRDSVGMCFTGRISRLINCLNGFSDLVSIEISDNEQINNIILLTKQRLGDDYTTDKHKELVENELRERGYSVELITEWLGFIE
jgi:Leucine-rich repeat (LRR) protein